MVAGRMVEGAIDRWGDPVLLLYNELKQKILQEPGVCTTPGVYIQITLAFCKTSSSNTVPIKELCPKLRTESIQIGKSEG